MIILLMTYFLANLILAIIMQSFKNTIDAEKEKQNKEEEYKDIVTKQKRLVKEELKRASNDL
jgi:hypothetical protein